MTGLAQRYSGKKVVVLGLGKSGLSTARILFRYGAKLACWDDGEAARAACAQEFGAEVIQPINAVDWATQDILFVSPGVPLHFPAPHEAVRLAHKHHVPISSDVDLMYQMHPHANYIGITGTNGKSTTTALVHHILAVSGYQSALAGNFGPAAETLPHYDEQGFYVVELSSYQLDLARAIKLSAACLLNITPDHIDRHGSFENYCAAKEKIFALVRPGGTQVLCIDDAPTAEIFRKLAQEVTPKQRLLPISTMREVPGGIALLEDTVHISLPGGDKLTMPLKGRAALPGAHNSQNIVTAFALCYVHGVPADKISEAIASFPGLAHRIQLVGERSNVRYINDSKATNAEATEKALSCYDSHIFWLAGGKPKEGGIEALKDYFPRVQKAYLYGEAKEQFAKTLKGKAEYAIFATLAEAFAAAHKDALHYNTYRPVVLLSPACASFDQFKNFEQRGEVFCQLVADVLKSNDVQAG